MFLIDTNIFLEILLEQEKKDECLKLVELVLKGKVEAVVTVFTIYSIAVILTPQKLLGFLIEFLSDLRSFIGLRLVNTSLDDKLRIARLAKEKGFDFDDAYQYYIAGSHNLKIVSFDRDFDKGNRLHKTYTNISSTSQQIVEGDKQKENKVRDHTRVETQLGRPLQLLGTLLP